ncbi:hypothetical protein [uncultured Fibrella sp.]|uniref:hypothetical protein n=1 Tax=uncultured Fibrella sp. TaxID=1284596 RepID=UPI0035CACC06
MPKPFPFLLKISGLTLVTIVASQPVNAQFIVSDPLHTGVTQLMKLLQDPSFKTLVKNVEDLKKVSNGVRQFHRGTELVKTVTGTTQTMSQMATTINIDGHIYPAEYTLIVRDFKAMADEGTSILKDMRQSTATNILQMNDAERMNWLNTANEKASRFQNKVNAYFYRVRALSLRRAGSLRDRTATARLYGISIDRMDRLTSGGSGGASFDNGSENGYNDYQPYQDGSVLDNYTQTAEAQRMRQAQEDYTRRLQDYQDRLELAEIEAKRIAMLSLISKGYHPVPPSKRTQGEIGWGTPDGQIISEQEFDIVLRMETRVVLEPIKKRLYDEYKLGQGFGG